MAIIRQNVLKGMDDKELEKKEDELRLELAKEKGKIYIGSVPENSGKIREMKKTIARILTQKNANNRNKTMITFIDKPEDLS